MTLNVNDAWKANLSTGSYLARTYNIDPPDRRMMPGIPRYSTESQRMRSDIDCDEVFPGIIVGTGRSAKNMKYLNKLGITHVVNAAEIEVHLNPAKLRKEGIAYKGFRTPNLPNSDIARHFDDCSEFIDRALSYGEGQVFVCSDMGFSRSATIVAAYLMKKRKMTASQALALMRRYREVKPNHGFLQQLGELDDQLRKERYRTYY